MGPDDETIGTVEMHDAERDEWVPLPLVPVTAAPACRSTRLDGKQCTRPALHGGVHLHETSNGTYGWENEDA